MNIIDLVAIVAIFTLSILILSVTLLPFIAAMMHVTYIVNDQLLTGCIGAMTGIVTAIVMKKMQAGSDSPKS